MRIGGGTAQDEILGEFAPRGRRAASRLIIRRASIDLLVDDQGEAISRLEARAGEMGGHVTDSTLNEDSAQLSVRVPSAQLDAFLDVVASIGEETRRSVTGEDVTDTYSDLEAEIANLTSLRGRLRTLLERADEVEEVLQVEKELTRVQTQLDSLVARRHRMKTDLRLSAVFVSITERAPKRVLGPLGLLYEGTKWLAIKLFVISP